MGAWIRAVALGGAAVLHLLAAIYWLVGDFSLVRFAGAVVLFALVAMLFRQRRDSPFAAPAYTLVAVVTSVVLVLGTGL